MTNIFQTKKLNLNDGATTMQFIDFCLLSINEMRKHLSYQYNYPQAGPGTKCLDWSCSGIYTELLPEGTCSCHINPPCNVCSNYTLYCTECGDDGAHELTEVDKRIQLEREFFTIRYRELRLFASRLAEEAHKALLAAETLCPTRILVHSVQCWHSGKRGRGTHNNRTSKEIIDTLGLPTYKEAMLILDRDNTTFSYSYFSD